MTDVPDGYTPTCGQCGKWFTLAKQIQGERNDAATEVGLWKQVVRMLEEKGDHAKLLANRYKAEAEFLRERVAELEQKNSDLYGAVAVTDRFAATYRVRAENAERELKRRDDAPRDAYDYDRIQDSMRGR